MEECIDRLKRTKETDSQQTNAVKTQQVVSAAVICAKVAEDWDR